MIVGGKKARSFLFGMVIATCGCAAYVDPSTIDRPAFPSLWGNLDRESLLGVCPKLAGEYLTIPDIVELDHNSKWGGQFSGEEHDYTLLFGAHRLNLKRPGAIEETRLEEPVGDGNSFGIEQVSSGSFTLIVTNSRDPQKAFRAKYERRLGDYSCVQGEMHFPNYRFKGGTEGGYFNELVVYSLYLIDSGDIAFYEQKHTGRGEVRHRYYRFSRIR